MKKLLITIAAGIFLSGTTQAAVLNVPQVIQEQDQWCWAGVTKCILDYYNFTNAQCTIAEYARTAITWTSYGTVNCCINATQGCNYWNYNYGYAGSIQDILVHFGNIQNTGLGNTIPLSQVNTEIAGGRPFVVRWGWYSGGGHFVVGHGVVDSNIYYMNPWFGEGLHVSTYNWLKDDGNHSWTHTNVLTTSPAVTPTAVQQTLLTAGDAVIYPNPATDKCTLTISGQPDKNTMLYLQDLTGRVVATYSITGNKAEINRNNLSDGVYVYKLQTGAVTLKTGKIVFE